MRKTAIISLASMVLALSFMLAGCEGATFSFTQMGNNITIEVNSAKEGNTAESSSFTVGKGRAAIVESTLDSGELRIDFAQATVFTHPDEPDKCIVGDVAASVIVGAGDRETVALEPGDYVLQVTAKGDTNGKITVKIEKS